MGTLGDVPPSVAAAFALGFKAGSSVGKVKVAGMTVASLQDTAVTAALLESGGISSTVAAEKSLLFAEVSGKLRR